MAKIDELIENLCPNGVEYKPIWSLTAWDKKFNGVDKEKQKKIISYKYYLSTDFAKVERKDGNIKYISTGISGDDRYTTEELAGDYLADGEVVCIPWGGTPNVKYHKGKFVTGDNRIATSLDINILSNKFLYYWMQSKINVISKFYRGSGIKHPSMKDVLDMNIAVPPLEVQCEIVHILDDFTLLSAELSAELKARQKQYEYYKDKLLNFDETANLCGCIYTYTHTHGYLLEKTKYYTLDEITNNIHSGKNKNKSSDGKYSVYGSTGVISKTTVPAYKKDNILIARVGVNAGYVYIAKGEYDVSDNTLIVELKDNINLKYVYYQLSNINLHQYARGGGQPLITAGQMKQVSIPVPNIKKQNEIVKILDKFDKLCNDISEGLPAEIEARQKQYEYYRDKLLTFKELKVNE